MIAHEILSNMCRKLSHSTVGPRLNNNNAIWRRKYTFVVAQIEVNEKLLDQARGKIPKPKSTYRRGEVDYINFFLALFCYRGFRKSCSTVFPLLELQWCSKITPVESGQVAIYSSNERPVSLYNMVGFPQAFVVEVFRCIWLQKPNWISKSKLIVMSLHTPSSS